MVRFASVAAAIAILAGTAAAQEPMLQAGAVYASSIPAPEQVVGDPVDSRTDVYALGVVLFRMITGQLPFDLPLGATLLRHHLYSPVPPLSWLIEGIDPRIERLVMRATRKDPVLRYPSMLALLADLDALVTDSALTPWLLGSEVRQWADSYEAPSFARDEKNLVKLRSFLSAKLPA